MSKLFDIPLAAIDANPLPAEPGLIQIYGGKV